MDGETTKTTLSSLSEHLQCFLQQTHKGMSVCTYYVYVWMDAYNVCMYIRMCMYVWKDELCICMCTYVCMCVCMYVWKDELCICMYVCMYVCMHVCMEG